MKNMTKSRKTVKGAVLFTVVAVMAVILIFLLATLSIVMAVQRRTASDYSSSQSYYTARSAVDSVVAALRDPSDQDLAKAIYEWNTGGASVTKQLTLNGIPNSMGTITSLTIENTGESWTPSPVADPLTIFKIRATAKVAEEESTVSLYIVGDPNMGMGGGGGGGTPFITAGTAAAGTNAPIYGTAIFSLEAPNNIDLTNASQLGGAMTIYGNVETGTSSALYMLGTGDGMVVYNNFNPSYGNLTIKNTAGVYGNTNLKISGASNYNVKGLSSTMTVVNEQQLKNIRSYKLADGISLIPYIYCDNVFKPGDSASKIGYASGDIFAPINIYCGSIDTTGYNNQFDNGIVGDIFCYNSSGTSVFKRTNTNNIIGWVAQNLGLTGDTTTIISGNMYTKGNLNIQEGTWVVNGNLYVEGSITVSGGSLTVNGRCNKSEYGTHDTTLDFPNEMDTYVSSTDGKTYPGVVYHEVDNKDGFIQSYYDLKEKTDYHNLALEASNIVAGAATMTFTEYSNTMTTLTTDTKFTSDSLSGDVVVDLKTLSGVPADDLYLYFPEGCKMNGKSITVNNLVDWQFVTDDEGYILDSVGGNRITDMAAAAVRIVPSSEGDNGKLPVQRVVLDGGTGNYKAVLAYCKIIVGSGKDFSMLTGERLLSEYYATKLGTKLHVYENGTENPEMVPCIEIYMDSGKLFMQNNAVVSGYAKCFDATLESNTSGTQSFKESLYTSMNNATVEVNSDKGGYVLWIGAFAFESMTTQNDTGLLFVDPTEVIATGGVNLGDYSIWYPLQYDSK